MSTLTMKAHLKQTEQTVFLQEDLCSPLLPGFGAGHLALDDVYLLQLEGHWPGLRGQHLQDFQIRIIILVLNFFHLKHENVIRSDHSD